MKPTENKYHHSKIYMITDKAYTKRYYGSTTQKLCERMSTHRKSYRHKRSATTAFSLFDEFGVDNCIIELVENVKCETKEDLHRVEGKYIRENECVNKVIPDRTIKEYRLDKKKDIQQYYQDNKEQILSKTKQDRINDPEKYRLRYKKYYEKNKDKKNETITCICGLSYSKSHKGRHESSKRHNDILLSRQNEKTIEI